MNKQNLGKKGFLKLAVSIAIVMTFVMPVSSTFESENISDDTTIGIEPYTMQMVKKGETFAISIHVIPSEPVICINVGNLSFNSSLIHANAVTEGNLFDPYETFTSGSIDNVAGNINGIEGTAIPSNATTDAGILCNISFTAQEEIGTSVLDIEDVVVINMSGSTISSTIKNDGLVTVVAWSVVLTFSEMSGREDEVVFAEMPDANNGPPADIYDKRKAPWPPGPPYLYAWFNDSLPYPYDFLWQDYRRYPDTHKVWDLYVKWDNNDTTPPDITISWNTSGFMGCEYASVILTRYNPFPYEDPVGWEFATDMFISDNYVYAPRYFSGMWLTDHFQINATDAIPPIISNVVLAASDPLDTDVPYGWENVTCTVIDIGIGVDTVKLVATDYDMTTTEYHMTNIPETDVYYCNTTITRAGRYEYHIWANDTNGNIDESLPEMFLLPMNQDVDMGGKVHFMDLIAVSLMYNEEGPNGWVREDVDNGGKVHFMDLIAVSLAYNEEW